MPDVVLSAERYPDGVIRALVQSDDGSKVEHDWFPVAETGLPPIELLSGQLMKAFVDEGGVISQTDALYFVPNYVPVPIPDPLPAPDPSSAPPATDGGIPEQISPRQFFMQAVVEGIISKADALGFMRNGTLPDVLVQQIGSLSDDEQYDAEMALLGSAYYRHNPVTIRIGQMIEKDEAWMDAFWKAAALIP